ncbi:hypothetical protein PIB30_040918 [Stylosanthes scabra]|uniref:Gag-pol polyprotein n=1 Tax=Stylosanthes scabra TaxID=79078 RepID=A0ABU6XCE5_9FABA|nr:hypothetical protein [Stylosanthes scabra]
MRTDSYLGRDEREIIGIDSEEPRVDSPLRCFKLKFSLSTTSRFPKLRIDSYLDRDERVVIRIDSRDPRVDSYVQTFNMRFYYVWRIDSGGYRIDSNTRKSCKSIFSARGESIQAGTESIQVMYQRRITRARWYGGLNTDVTGLEPRALSDVVGDMRGLRANVSAHKVVLREVRLIVVRDIYWTGRSSSFLMSLRDGLLMLHGIFLVILYANLRYLCDMCVCLACVTRMETPTRGRGRPRNAPTEDEPDYGQREFFAAMANMANTVQAGMAAVNAAHANPAEGGNGAGPANVRPMTLANFLKINPPTFQGTSDPSEVDDWFLAVERALVAQQVPEDQYVVLATYLLTGEAQHW